MAGNILGNAAGAADLALLVTNGEEGVADPAHRPIRADDAELFRDGLSQPDQVKCASTRVADLPDERSGSSGRDRQACFRLFRPRWPQRRGSGIRAASSQGRGSTAHCWNSRRTAGSAPRSHARLLRPACASLSQGRPGEPHRLAIFEGGPALGGNPTLDPIPDPDDAVLDVVDPVTCGVDTMRERGLDLSAILGMNAG